MDNTILKKETLPPNENTSSVPKYLEHVAAIRLERNHDIEDYKRNEPYIRSGHAFALSLPSMFSRTDRDFIAMRSEKNRLDSFFLQPGWPANSVTPGDCAKAGFFCLQDADKVQCAFCFVTLGEFENGETPMEEHKRHFNRCPFVCQLPVGNIPLELNDSSYEEEDKGVDVCGRLASVTESSTHPVNCDNNFVLTNLGIIAYVEISRSDLVTLSSRLKTFRNWPGQSGQLPKKLAQAGFFYTGTSHNVKCFSCGGEIQKWTLLDDPFLKHVQRFPNCTFMLLNYSGNHNEHTMKKMVESTPILVNTDVGINEADGRNGSKEKIPVETETTGALQEVAERLTCKICAEKEVNVVFLPCRHLVTCASCAAAVAKCVLCRNSIKGFVKIFLSPMIIQKVK